MVRSAKYRYQPIRVTRKRYAKDYWQYKHKYGLVKPSRYVRKPNYYNTTRRLTNKYAIPLSNSVVRAIGTGIVDSIIDLAYNIHNPSVKKKIILSLAKTILGDKIRYSKPIKPLPKIKPHQLKQAEHALNKAVYNTKRHVNIDLLTNNLIRDIKDIHQGVYFKNLYRRYKTKR